MSFKHLLMSRKDDFTAYPLVLHVRRPAPQTLPCMHTPDSFHMPEPPTSGSHLFILNIPVAIIMDSPPLASLSLTHVHYDPSDPISHLCAYLALTPQALVITYVALIWATREVEILSMFAGQMGCEALNWVLKRTIKEERPSRTSIT